MLLLALKWYATALLAFNGFPGDKGNLRVFKHSTMSWISKDNGRFDPFGPDKDPEESN